MRRLETDPLHVFVTIAKTGSLSAAAEALYRSQSTVSESLKKLELTCGAALFIRNKRGARLTPAGERLLPHAKAILTQGDAALADLRGMALAGDLHVAITDYFLPGKIAPMLAHLVNQYPDLRLRVAIENAMRLARAQADHRYDIVVFLRIAGMEHPGARLDEMQVIKTEKLHWLAADGWSPPRDSALPLVTLPEGCQIQHHAFQTLERHHLNIQTYHSAASVSGLQAALQAGLGVGCLNESAIPPGVSRLPASNGLPDLGEAQFCISYQSGHEDVAGELKKVFQREIG